MSYHQLQTKQRHEFVFFRNIPGRRTIYHNFKHGCILYKSGVLRLVQYAYNLRFCCIAMKYSGITTLSTEICFHGHSNIFEQHLSSETYVYDFLVLFITLYTSFRPKLRPIWIIKIINSWRATITSDIHYIPRHFVTCSI